METRGTRRWWVLAAMVFAVFAVTLDVTVVNVALPTLAGELKASESQLQWFVTAYTLALVAGMLPAGLIGDRYGRKLLLCSGLVLFIAGSLGCAYASSPLLFILARVALGLAGAVLIVMVLSIVAVMFKPEERTRAIGLWGAANFIGLPLGPIVGGWILSNAWWGWVFLMNVPVALLGLVAVLTLVPQSKAIDPPDLDVAGVAISSVGLIALMYGLTEAGDNGWTGMAIVWSIAGLLALASFVLWERWLMDRGGLRPLVDLSLFRSRSFTWGVICTSFGVFGLFGVMFVLPQYFQAIMGVDAQGSGFRLLPVVLGMVLGLGLALRLLQRLGGKLTVAFGFIVVAAGTLFGTTMTVASGDPFMAAWSLVVGTGAGLGFSGAMAAALFEIDDQRSGVASALVQTIVKLGPAFGATILGSVMNATYESQVSVAGLPIDAAAAAKSSVFGAIAVARQGNSAALLESARAAFVAGMDDALRLAAIVAIVATLLAVVFLPGRVRTANTPEAPRTQASPATVE